ncbi:hypothetical protein SISNIDRAFT_462396 [Sistotremastrum niveocremeum HHB9708]|uniref:Uncharacterized protein n=1 Tax=Sistotremastrum niveocremeum HHB9708 TaxID=1314777 RepID=A0A165A3S4_9AGAM|nr:hypothetical protein SISNIDRAFT_462396 [Sistotremastrum niveocremeum HHB9708]
MSARWDVTEKRHNHETIAIVRGNNTIKKDKALVLGVFSTTGPIDTLKNHFVTRIWRKFVACPVQASSNEDAANAIFKGGVEVNDEDVQKESETCLMVAKQNPNDAKLRQTSAVRLVDMKTLNVRERMQMRIVLITEAVVLGALVRMVRDTKSALGMRLGANEGVYTYMERLGASAGNVREYSGVRLRTIDFLSRQWTDAPRGYLEGEKAFVEGGRFQAKCTAGGDNGLEAGGGVAEAWLTSLWPWVQRVQLGFVSSHLTFFCLQVRQPVLLLWWAKYGVGWGLEETYRVYFGRFRMGSFLRSGWTTRRVLYCGVDGDEGK